MSRTNCDAHRRVSRSARRRPSCARSRAGTTILDIAVDEDEEGRRHDARRATRRSCCTTPSASRSTSRSRSPRRPGSPSTAPRSTRSCTEQRTRAKADAKAKKGALADLSVYSRLPRAGRDGLHRLRPTSRPSRACSASSSTASPCDRASPGQIAEVILAETVAVRRVRRPGRRPGRHRRHGLRARGARRAEARQGPHQPHRARSRSGEVGVGRCRRRRVVDAAIPPRGARRRTRRPTSCTRRCAQTLGQEAHQAGSFNKAGYMRLDFTLEPGALARDPQPRSRRSPTTRCATTSR